MDNVLEVVALLRKHSELELQILNGHGAAVATERELEATVRRLAARPHALNAVSADSARVAADAGCRVGNAGGGLGLLELGSAPPAATAATCSRAVRRGPTGQRSSCSGGSEWIGRIYRSATIRGG
jgi:hypothetical protein